MTHDEMIAVIQAHKEGKQLEVRDVGTREWITVCEPLWNFRKSDYRIKPAEPKKVKVWCFYTRSGLVWKTEDEKTPEYWIRVPSEDKEIEIPQE